MSCPRIALDDSPRQVDAIGREMLRPDRAAVSDLPKHHRQRRSRDAAPDRRGDRPRDPRGRDRNAVFDWTVPKEWNIRDAYIKNRAGERVVDFNASNLHVVNYSVPIQARMTLAELRPHLFSLPEHPDWIPYKTSYYSETWGFCLPDRQFESLTDDVYEVCIDSSLETGHLTYGECCLPGRDADEVLVSCHVCHPSLCNDNLSGVSVAVTLAKLLQAQRRATPIGLCSYRGPSERSPGWR